MKACTTATYNTKQFKKSDFAETIKNASVQLMGMEELEEATKRNQYISDSAWFIKTDFNKKNCMVNTLMHDFSDYEKNLDHFGGEKYMFDFYFPYKEAMLNAIMNTYPELKGSCIYLIRKLHDTKRQYGSYWHKTQNSRNNKNRRFKANHK